jgi:glycosyltransferase involved in cell wall biosynthesis
MRFLIIPCYNEFSRLQASEVVSCVDNLGCIVVLVNDGSTDKTQDLLQQISLVRPAEIKVLDLDRNVGKGEAVRAGFNFAISQGASEVGFCDADFERSVFRHYLGRMFATLVSAILKQEIYDTQCGAKVFRINSITANIFSKPFHSRWAFDVEILGRINRLTNFESGQVIELPLLRWIEQPGSKLTVFSRLTTALELFKIKQSLKSWKSL